MKAKYFVLAALLAGAVSLPAETYYWTGTVKNKLFDDINNWAMDKDGAIPATSTPTANDAIDVSVVPLDSDSNQIGLNAYTELGDITNTGGTSNDFEIFFWDSNSVLKAGNIIQNSSSKAMDIRGRTGYSGFDVTVGNIDVLAGILRFGRADAGTALTNLTVNGNASISSESYLNFYVTDALTVNGNIENNGGTLQIVPTDDHPINPNQYVAIGGITSVGGSNTIYSYNGGTIGDVSVADGTFRLYSDNSGRAENQEFNIKSISLTNTAVSDKNALIIGSGDIATYAYSDTTSIKTLNTGDIYYKMASDAAWFIDTLNVKADLYEGATGTMTLESIADNRARFVIQNMNVDNLIVGMQDGPSVTAFEMFRGSNASNEFVFGSVNIGNLDVKNNIQNFRMGYLYNVAPGGNSFVKYSDINIGSLSVYNTAEFYADKISVGSINKADTSAALKFGGNQGLNSNSVTIGTDASSQTVVAGGTLSIYTKDLSSKGDILIAPGSTNNASLYLNDATTPIGDFESQTINLDSLTLNTTNAQASANLNRSHVTTTNINKISFTGANSATVSVSSSESMHIGEISVDSYVNASGETKNSWNNWVNISGEGAVTIDTINANAYDVENNIRNAVTIQSSDALTDLVVDTANIEAGAALNFGQSTSGALNSLTINTLNQNGEKTYDRGFYVSLQDPSSWVNIGEMNVTIGVTRMNGNANFEIGTMNLGSEWQSGAADLSSTSIVKIGTLNKTGSSTMRFGGSSAYIDSVQIGTYNMDSSGWVAFYTADNKTTIDKLNINANGSLQFYEDASIGELNVINVPSGIASLQSQDNLLTIGSTNIAGSVSLDGNVQINDSINIKSGGIVTLGSTAAGYTVTAKGITGNTGTWVDRVQASNSVSLVLNGDEGQRYFFDGRIMDFSAEQTDPTQLGDAILSLTVNSGIQVLACINSYRGTTTVNGGTLLLNGSPNNMSDTTLGAIVLNGGEFGAVGRSADIGAIKAQSLSWSNGATMLFDINSATEFDQIILSGALTKGTSDAEGLYNFEFTITNGDIAGQEFALITFDSTDFSAEDFSGSFTNMGDNWSATFDVRDNTVYATIIPEPSTYAAIFGVITLFAAYMRKRKINLK